MRAREVASTYNDKQKGLSECARDFIAAKENYDESLTSNRSHRAIVEYMALRTPAGPPAFTPTSWVDPLKAEAPRSFASIFGHVRTTSRMDRIQEILRKNPDTSFATASWEFVREKHEEFRRKFSPEMSMKGLTYYALENSKSLAVKGRSRNIPLDILKQMEPPSLDVEPIQLGGESSSPDVIKDHTTSYDMRGATEEFFRYIKEKGFSPDSPMRGISQDPKGFSSLPREALDFSRIPANEVAAIIDHSRVRIIATHKACYPEQAIDPEIFWAALRKSCNAFQTISSDSSITTNQWFYSTVMTVRELARLGKSEEDIHIPPDIIERVGPWFKLSDALRSS